LGGLQIPRKVSGKVLVNLQSLHGKVSLPLARLKLSLDSTGDVYCDASEPGMLGRW
jgi:hypothetical protein